MEHYGKVIGRAVRAKWPTPELKEWWYTKHSAVRAAKTRRLSESQNHHCAFCGCDTWLTKEDRRKDQSNGQQATLEHVTPQSEGGTDHMWNVVMACMRCNSLRGVSDPYEFCEFVKTPHFQMHYNLSKKERMVERSERRAAKKLERAPEKELRLVARLALLFWMMPAFEDWALAYAAERSKDD